jgi:hypothetical protein
MASIGLLDELEDTHGDVPVSSTHAGNPPVPKLEPPTAWERATAVVDRAMRDTARNRQGRTRPH